jgi:transposase
VAEAAGATPDARRLLTHPGVGPLTALTAVLVLGPVSRFPGSKHVVSYIGLAPVVHASADKYRLGQISRSVSKAARCCVGCSAKPRPSPLEAMPISSVSTLTIMRRRGRPKAKVALARRLLVRLYIMLRDQIDHEEFCRRGRAARVRKDRVPSPA